jgi:hypothetical protein
MKAPATGSPADSGAIGADRARTGERWYAWPWVGTASPRHSLPVRRHLKTGELAFHYCCVPEGQLAVKARPIRAAGLRWPVEESFRFGKGCFGLDQCQARLYTAILRHIVLVMAALAVCAVTAALLRGRTDAPLPSPARPGDAARWLHWRRRHQARSRWFHQRARLERNYVPVS